MRVGVLTGLAAEARLLRGFLFDGRNDLVIALTGACAERARVQASRLASSGVDALMSFGLAGGLDPNLQAGDLILADGVVLPCGRRIATDPRWLRHAADRLVRPEGRTYVGAVAGSHRLLSTPDDKRRLKRRSGALAGDMESGATAEAAEAAGLPFLALRAVSDGAGRALPTVARLPLDADGRVDFAGIAHALLTRPREWPAVARLAIETRAAMTALVGAVRSGALRPPQTDGAVPATFEKAPAYAV